jgi:hypothetical protein
MNRQMIWTIGGLALVVGALNLGLSCVATYAQSPVVFMTIDVASPTLQSRLVRFNSGAEAFSVNAGTPNAFQGVTPLGNDLLVADYTNNRIERFSTTGSYLGQFAAFTDPTFLESDSSGNVYTDNGGINGSTAVTRFNSSGAITQTYSDANLNDPYGVDADAAGNVYVVDGGGAKELFKFAANGTFLNSIALPFSPFDLAIDEVGQRLYIANQATSPSGVRIYDISGAVPAAIGSIITPSGSQIVGVHYSPTSGTVLAASFSGPGFAARGLEYSTSGTLLDEYFPVGVVEALDITTPGIPEPSTLVLLVLGVLGMGVRARRAG